MLQHESTGGQAFLSHQPLVVSEQLLESLVVVVVLLLLLLYPSWGLRLWSQFGSLCITSLQLADLEDCGDFSILSLKEKGEILLLLHLLLLAQENS